MNTGQTHNRNGNHPIVIVLHVFKAVRQKLNKIIAPKWLMKTKAHCTHDVDSEKCNVETEKLI